MFQVTKLVEWYYKADYTFIGRKKYPKILESLDGQTIDEIRKIINTIVTDKELLEIIVNALYLVRQGADISAINREYLEKLSQIEKKIISWKRWDCLRFLLCANGLLQMSHICREKAISRLCENSNAYGALRRFAHEIEHGNYNAAYDLLKSKCFRGLRLLYKKQYMHCVDICTTLIGKKKNSDEFGRMIENKRVVILGPATHDKGMNDYDEDKDIIVRFTYRGKDYLPECDKEIPTDVSYYNGFAENYEKHHDISDAKQDLKFACYKRQGIKEKFDESPKIRRVHLFDPCIGFGQANLMPDAVFDCLHYNVALIYVRNCNLYMAKNFYDHQYSIVENLNNKKLLYSFAKHDYEGQFNLLKALYMAGKFQCDEECNDVLTLSVDEYIQKMEIIFGRK